MNKIQLNFLYHLILIIIFPIIFIFNTSSSRYIINTLIITLIILTSNLMTHNDLKLKRNRKLIINLNKIRVIVSSTTLLLITLLLIIFMLTTYFSKIKIEQYFSVDLLIEIIMFFIVVDSILLNKLLPN